MKILVFSDVFGSVTTTFIRNEVEYFASKYQLLYLAQKVENEVASIRTSTIPFSVSLLKRKLIWYLWKLDILCTFKNKKFAIALNDILQREKPEVIHCHFAFEAIKIIENIDHRITTPIFVHFHGYDASQMLNKRSYIRTITRCLNKDNVYPIVVSNYMLDKLRALGIVMNAFVLRYGIDLALFSIDNAKQTRQKKRFIQVASLTEKKGHEFTIRAFGILLEENPGLVSDLELVIVGEGPALGRLELLVGQLGLQESIKFLGKTTAKETMTLLAEADFFVHHSITAANGDQEGIPNAIMEAMAMKLPVLSTKHAGIPELVKHGVNGLLCEERDIETYAAQMLEILSWKKLDENREDIQENYNMDKHNKALEELYHEKIAAHGN